MPGPYDQDLKDPMNSVAIDAVGDLLFPTFPMFNRSENFAKFDVHTLFFVFYYQPGTY
jgi:CCR4-NOT transcriptional regulation complex NOT5 subunit